MNESAVTNIKIEINAIGAAAVYIFGKEFAGKSSELQGAY